MVVPVTHEHRVALQGLSPKLLVHGLEDVCQSRLWVDAVWHNEIQEVDVWYRIEDSAVQVSKTCMNDKFA